MKGRFEMGCDDAAHEVASLADRQVLARLGLYGLASSDTTKRREGVLRLEQLLRQRYDTGWEEGDYHGWRRGCDQSMWAWMCVGFAAGISFATIGFVVIWQSL